MPFTYEAVVELTAIEAVSAVSASFAKDADAARFVPVNIVPFTYDAVVANDAVVDLLANDAEPCSEPVNDDAVTFPTTVKVVPLNCKLLSPFKVLAVPVAVII